MLTWRLHNRSMCVSHRPDQHDGPQRRGQQSLQLELPLSPSPSTADVEGMLSDYVETFPSRGLNGTSDDDCEPSDPFGNNEYSEVDYSEFMTWKDETEQEEEQSASDTAELGSLATYPMHSPSFLGDVHSETSHAALESLNTCAEPFQAISDHIEAFEQIGEQFRPGRPVGLKMSTNYYGFQPPSIIVSNNASEEAADRDPAVLPKSYHSIDLPMAQIDIKEDTRRPSNISVVPLQRRTRPRDLDGYMPNNYEMATQDRQPPDIPNGIDPQSEKIVGSLSAFNADLDSISADAVAATNRIDLNLSRVKRRPRLPWNHPVMQTPTNNFPLLQHWQKPSSNPRAFPPDQHRLQVPTYPPPPLSFQGSPAYQRHDSPFTTDSTLSTQPTPSPHRSTRPSSTFSPSPSTLTEADDDTIRCPNCADAIFTGPNKKNSLQRHQRDKHSDMLRLECLEQGCAVTFAPGRKDNLLKHVRATHPDYFLPPPSKKRKRKLDSGWKMCWADGASFGYVGGEAIQ